MLNAIINATASGNNTIVAAVTGKKIRVVSIVMVVSGQVTTTWEDGAATASSGPMAWGTSGGGYVAPPHPQQPGGMAGYMDTAVGQALVLNLSGAVQVGGHITYLLV